MERVPIQKNSKIIIDGQIVFVEELIGRGGSCLVYRGYIDRKKQDLPNLRMVIKEFYPITSRNGITRNSDNQMLIIPAIVESEDEEYQYKKRLFDTGRKMQEYLANSSLMEVTVKPFLYGTYGDSVYLLSHENDGISLDKKHFETLDETLDCILRMVELIGILERNGYMLMDFKPENLLYIHEPKSVKLLDVDSIFAYADDAHLDLDHQDRFRKLTREISGISNDQYTAPELHRFRTCVERGEQISQVYQDYLGPGANIYSLGIYLQEQLTQLMERIRVRFDIQDMLLEIIRNATQSKKYKRYESARQMFDALNRVKELARLPKYIPKEEVSQANATFSSYCMLQKYPMYHYWITKEDGTHQIQAAIIGDYSMRANLFAAMLSIGQMANTELVIHLFSGDAEKFWQDYTSDAQNPYLKYALEVYLEDELYFLQNYPVGNGLYLVDVPLAKVYLHRETDFEKILKCLLESQIRYLIFMEERTELNTEYANAYLRTYVENHADYDMTKWLKEKVFVCYLNDQYEFPRIQIPHLENGRKVFNPQVYAINVYAFCENYNQRMYRERIYKMGRMAHAYYCGYMEKEGAEVDLDALDDAFRSDLYNMASSERCALHGMYAMASVGVDLEQPGRSLRFYHKISDEAVMAQLAHHEHRSWMAYLLTTGAVPVTMEEFAEFAYRDGNNWKDLTNMEHMRHPLLVESNGQMYEEDYLSILSKAKGDAPEIYERLDGLDKRSIDIWRWYLQQKETYLETFDRLFSTFYQMITESYLVRKTTSLRTLAVDLKMEGELCIRAMASRMCNQNQGHVKKWKQIEQALRTQVEYDSQAVAYLDQINTLMIPVFDSYKNRDFKQSDRNMIWAILDMIL